MGLEGVDVGGVSLEGGGVGPLEHPRLDDHLLQLARHRQGRDIGEVGAGVFLGEEGGRGGGTV